MLRKRTRTETVKGTRKETRKRKGKGKVERRKECEGKRGKEKVQRDPAGMEWGFSLGKPADIMADKHVQQEDGRFRCRERARKVATSGVEKANENGNGQGNEEGDAEAEGKGKGRREKGMRREKGKGKSAARPSDSRIHRYLVVGATASKRAAQRNTRFILS